MLIAKVVVIKKTGLGAKMRAARLKYQEEHGVTYTALSKKADLARAHWDRVEAESRGSFAYETVLKIQRALGESWVEDDGRELAKVTYRPRKGAKVA